MSALLDTNFDFRQGDAAVPRLNEAVKEVHEEDYRHVRSIAWRNSHTRRFAALLGDDKLVCGFDARAGLWAFARLVKRTVVTNFGVRETRVVEEVPVIWWHLEDDSVTPPAFVRIDDPRVPGMLQKGDSYRNPGQWTKQLKARNARRAEKRAQRKREGRDRLKEGWKLFCKEADAYGYSAPHRAVAADGGKIFSYSGERDRDPATPLPIKVNDKRVR